MTCIVNNSRMDEIINLKLTQNKPLTEREQYRLLHNKVEALINKIRYLADSYSNGRKLGINLSYIIQLFYEYNLLAKDSIYSDNVKDFYLGRNCHRIYMFNPYNGKFEANDVELRDNEFFLIGIELNNLFDFLTVYLNFELIIKLFKRYGIEVFDDKIQYDMKLSLESLLNHELFNKKRNSSKKLSAISRRGFSIYDLDSDEALCIGTVKAFDAENSKVVKKWVNVSHLFYDKSYIYFCVFLNNGKLKLGIKTTRFYGHYIYFDLKNLREYNTLIKPNALFQFDKSINQLKGLIKKDRFNNKILNILYKLGISDKPIYTKNRIFDNSTFILRDDVLKSPLWYLFKYFGKS